MRLWIAAFMIAMMTLSCGSLEDGGDANRSGDEEAGRAGMYHIGDMVKYKISRASFKLTEFYLCGEVVSVEGSAIDLRWTDTLDNEGLQLVDWTESDNPYVEKLDYNAGLGDPSGPSTYSYDAEEKTNVETEVGTFECMIQKYRVTEEGKSRDVERCRSPKIAITKYVYLQVSYLGDDGNSTKSWRHDLVANRKL